MDNKKKFVSLQCKLEESFNDHDIAGSVWCRYAMLKTNVIWLNRKNPFQLNYYLNLIQNFLTNSNDFRCSQKIILLIIIAITGFYNE